MANKTRRQALKGLFITAPAVWTTPIVNSIILPAHAQTSPVAKSCAEMDSIDDMTSSCNDPLVQCTRFTYSLDDDGCLVRTVGDCVTVNPPENAVDFEFETEDDRGFGFELFARVEVARSGRSARQVCDDPLDLRLDHELSLSVGDEEFLLSFRFRVSPDDDPFVAIENIKVAPVG